MQIVQAQLKFVSGVEKSTEYDLTEYQKLLRSQVNSPDKSYYYKHHH